MASATAAAASGTRKRAASASRRVAEVREEAPTPKPSHGLRLSQALAAISAAQAPESEPKAIGQADVKPARKAPRSAAAVKAASAYASAEETSTKVAAHAPKPKTPRAPKRVDIAADEEIVPVLAPRLQEDEHEDGPWMAPMRPRNVPETIADDDDDDLGVSQADFASMLAEAAASSADTRASSPRTGLGAWIAALDKLPPIRLPIGPAIPWRVGLPALIGLMVVMLIFSRPSARSTDDTQGVQLPATQTYPVQQQAPLFTNQQADQAQPAAQSPIGVAEPTGVGGFDIMDVGLKLVAVLALAYGSLMLLKKAGIGGAAGSGKTGGSAAGMKVISSLVLAPNRTVHAIGVPGGKTLLIAATPTQVNLIAELADFELEQATADGGSFLEILTSKLH